jgi:hypothetical protein
VPRTVSIANTTPRRHDVSDPEATGYAPVNGVEMYWESRVSGGTPLIFPRDPDFAVKPDGRWTSTPASLTASACPDEYVISADEKTQLRALGRHPDTVAPSPACVEAVARDVRACTPGLRLAHVSRAGP